MDLLVKYCVNFENIIIIRNAENMTAEEIKRAAIDSENYFQKCVKEEPTEISNTIMSDQEFRKFALEKGYT